MPAADWLRDAASGALQRLLPVLASAPRQVSAKQCCQPPQLCPVMCFVAALCDYRDSPVTGLTKTRPCLDYSLQLLMPMNVVQTDIINDTRHSAQVCLRVCMYTTCDDALLSAAAASSSLPSLGTNVCCPGNHGCRGPSGWPSAVVRRAGHRQDRPGSPAGHRGAPQLC